MWVVFSTGCQTGSVDRVNQVVDLTDAPGVDDVVHAGHSAFDGRDLLVVHCEARVKDASAPPRPRPPRAAAPTPCVSRVYGPGEEGGGRWRLRNVRGAAEKQP